jgi:hypothetical protein
MIDRIFSAALTFTLLAGGTLAIGSALFGFDRLSAQAQVQSAVIELPRVEIVGRRASVEMPRVEVVAQRATVELPRVEITGRRPSIVIANTDAASATRLR